MSQPKIALIGANGMLASMLRQTVPESFELHLFDLPEFDITHPDQIATTLTALNPDVIINCAAFTQVDNCEAQHDLAFRVNGSGPGYLASAAKKNGAILVHISTDFVFSGDTISPYSEEAATGPLSVYGLSKLQGEQAIQNSGLIDYYIVRTSWLYGPNGSNFVDTIIRMVTEREELGIVADQTGTPTYTGDLADAIWTLILSAIHRTLSITAHPSHVTAPPGIYHYSNGGECSWYDFACAIVQQLREMNVPLQVTQVKPITTEEYPVPAKRPAYSVMSKDKIIALGVSVPTWQESLSRYLTRRIKGDL